MRKTFVISLLVMMCLPVLSGCWNQKELTDLAFVMAIGIDKGKAKRFDISFQIVNPGNVSSGQNGGGQGLPIAVYKSSGNTLTEAARNATKMISRRLYYSHTNLIAVSEEIARDGILDIMDALDRDPEFRTTTQMVISRETTAEDLVSTLTNLDKLPVNKITKEIKSTEKMLGENISVSIDDFLAGIVSDGKDPVINGYKVHGNKQQIGEAADLQKTKSMTFLEADGLAAFKNGKLTGWFENEKARGVVYVMDKVQSTDISVDWKGKKHAITMAPIRSKTRVTVHFKNGKPVINVAIEGEGWISEANLDIDLTNPKIIEKIDKLVEKKIKGQVSESIKAAQKKKSDIFGFGERVHRANPKLWKKVRGDWKNHFAELEVNVKVDSYIRREGIRTNPFWYNMD